MGRVSYRKGGDYRCSNSSLSPANVRLLKPIVLYFTLFGNSCKVCMTWILKERYRDLHKGTIVAIIRIPTPLSKDSDRGKTLKNPQKLLKFVLVMIPKSSKILPIILPTIETKPVVNYFYWTNYRTLSVDHDFNIKYVEWFGMIPKKVFVLSHLENNKKGTKPHYRLGLVPLKWFFLATEKLVSV